MSTLSVAQTYQLLRGAGFSGPQAVQMVAIGLAESGLRTDAIGDTTLTNGTWGPSVGLFQVRTLKAQAGTGKSRDQAALLASPAAQAAAAYEISGGGTNLKPWSTWNSGSAAKQLATVYAALGMSAGSAPPPADASSGAAASTDAQNAGLWDTLTNPGGAVVDELTKLVKPIGDLATRTLLAGVFLAAGAALAVIGFNRLVAPVRREVIGGMS